MYLPHVRNFYAIDLDNDILVSAEESCKLENEIANCRLSINI